MKLLVLQDHYKNPPIWSFKGCRFVQYVVVRQRKESRKPEQENKKAWMPSERSLCACIQRHRKLNPGVAAYAC